jgi:hypothetical protein
MLTGFNTDFKYKGTVYHVQTEDNGINNPTIITLLYQGGAILASRKTSYGDILKFEKLEMVVKELMENQHKQVIKDLIAGKFVRPGEKMEPEKPEPEPEAEENNAKTLDDVILDYLASEDGPPK